MLRVLIFIFLVFTSSIATSAPVTGPIKPEAILHFYPELNAVGTAYRVPVVVGGVTGVAEIGKSATTARMLLNGTIGRLGFWGMAAVTAAQLCYEETDWKICHSTQDALINATGQTSNYPATSYSRLYASYPNDNYIYTDPDQACSLKADYTNSIQSIYSYQSTGVSSVDSSPRRCQVVRTRLSDNVQFVFSDAAGNSFYSPVSVYWSPSSGYICNVGDQLSGTSCIHTVYSCPENYALSDSSGNLTDSGVFCSFQSPPLTEVQRNDILAPILLNYYANQLFSDNDGKLDPSYFSDADTTFDPTVTPSDMPMTWDQLKNYVDWVRTGVAQTTDPLAPHYISPTNYDYTNNYITNNDSVTNNTSSATSTNITPQQTASSAAMTQSQFEASTKKMDTETATAINATDTTSLDNQTTQSGFDDANNQLTDIANGDIGDLPLLPTPNLPGYSSCQTLDLSWKGHAAVFPSPSQCQKMEEAKRAFGYILYLITFIGLVWEVLRRVE